jgi:hypothetical protein
VGKPIGKRLLRRHRRRWEYNIKMDGVAWTGFIWFRIETSGGLL